MPLPTARLLLVDDDTSALQVMNSMLSAYPDKRFATSGKVALRLARELTPDLILLDVMMPGMTGFEIFSALKRDPALADVPVVFVSAHDTEALQEAGATMGASVFISKPMVAAQLRAAVTRYLGQAPEARPSGTVSTLQIQPDRAIHQISDRLDVTVS